MYYSKLCSSMCVRFSFCLYSSMSKLPLNIYGWNWQADKLGKSNRPLWKRPFWICADSSKRRCVTRSCNNQLLPVLLPHHSRRHPSADTDINLSWLQPNFEKQTWHTFTDLFWFAPKPLIPKCKPLNSLCISLLKYTFKNILSAVIQSRLPVYLITIEGPGTG